MWVQFWLGKIPWRRKWQLTPVFLPRESHGQRSLVGYSPQGCRVGHNYSNLARAYEELDAEWSHSHFNLVNFFLTEHQHLCRIDELLCIYITGAICIFLLKALLLQPRYYHKRNSEQEKKYINHGRAEVKAEELPSRRSRGLLSPRL